MTQYRDKLMHAAAGMLTALVALMAWSVMSYLGVADMRSAPAAVALASVLVGVAKECDDSIRNAIACKSGLPIPNSVEFLDAAATAAPGLLLSSVLYWC